MQPPLLCVVQLLFSLLDSSWFLPHKYVVEQEQLHHVFFYGNVHVFNDMLGIAYKLFKLALLQLIIGKGQLILNLPSVWLCEGMSLCTAWEMREKGCDLRQSAV